MKMVTARRTYPELRYPQTIPESLDFILAYHCAPTLLGIKPSSLIRIPKASQDALQQYLEEYLEPLKMLNLKDRGETIYVLIYREEELGEILEKEENQRLLADFDYPVTCPFCPFENLLDGALQHLVKRWELCRFCPHEIGLFLGYPNYDVQGFIEHGGRAAMCGGYWRVFDQREKAEETFRLYDASRAYLVRDLLLANHFLAHTARTHAAKAHTQERMRQGA